MFAVLNSKIGKQSSSVFADAHGSELIARDESGVPVTQISCEVKSMCGSNVAESATSVAGLGFLVSGIVVHTVDVFGVIVKHVG